eukprot:5528511-Amphidinium_carterae.1
MRIATPREQDLEHVFFELGPLQSQPCVQPRNGHVHTEKNRGNTLPKSEFEEPVSQNPLDPCSQISHMLSVQSVAQSSRASWLTISLG